MRTLLATSVATLLAFALVTPAHAGFVKQFKGKTKFDRKMT